ncbi:hypothetical protein [Paracoccus tibetensis]|uniref:Uncharacterized protein n=1 Tax=Paracoccus tibetensis TaxID=336292 RepID=A0A1G5BAF7_9RHOB|nr:hypothetical protein [Paracoccus tibetensis]SCX87102.1 hypothetical protein SAMN05660710_00062 [Paracoccus tibetensis]
MTSDQHHGSAGGDELGLGELKEQASQKVSQVADSLKQEAARREDSIRDNLSKQADSLASALRSAKSEIDPQSGIGKMFDYAADSVGSMAHSLKSADTAEMVDSVRSFARERPGAFLGLCALGGFGAARFLIAGAPSAGRSTGTGMTGSHGRTGSQTGLADRSGASLASQQQGGQASIHGHGSGASGGTSGSHMGSAGSASPTGSGMSGGSGSGMSGSGTTGSGTTGSGTAGSATGSGVGGDLVGNIGGNSTGTGSSSGAEKARVPGYGNAPGTSGTGGGQ